MTLITRVSSNFMAYLAFYKYVFTLLCIQGNILYWGKNMCLSRMILGKALRCLNAFGTYQCTYICDGAYTIGNSLSKCFIRRTLCFFGSGKISSVWVVYMIIPTNRMQSTPVLNSSNRWCLVYRLWELIADDYWINVDKY